MSNHQCDIDAFLSDIDFVDELTYNAVDSRYRNVQMVLTALGYILLGGAALFLLLIDNPLWCIMAESAIIVAMAVNLFILRKAWLFKGYALREQDLSYRSGVVFPSITTIPYSRLQQVSVKQNPVSKIFKLYSVEVTNGAQALSSITIPGLTEEKAANIKNLLINKLRNEPN
ncbi:MAG: PH domain-containing protein [Muribaculaceae bacterium]|nr:PH domain-containing protein [Muribaculaceae bacterium]